MFAYLSAHSSSLKSRGKRVSIFFSRGERKSAQTSNVCNKYKQLFNDFFFLFVVPLAAQVFIKEQRFAGLVANISCCLTEQVDINLMG